MRQEKAITLIALVITIIILLILAGISIATLLGENGVLTKAQRSKEETIIETEKEQIALAYSTCVEHGEKVGEEELEKELKNYDKNVTVEESYTFEDLKVEYTKTKHTYLIDENGNITLIDNIEIDKELTKQEINDKESVQAFANPDRGFYTPVSVDISNILDIDFECKQAIGNEQTILHLRINIGALSGNANLTGVDKDFSKEQLEQLNSIFSTIRSNNLNAIVRFAYDFDGNEEKEPKEFNTIKKHIKQLSSIFESNKDVITCIEAGFIGPWGEMHDGGKYENDKYYKNLIEELLANTPESMTINVRKPYFYKLVFNTLNNSSKDRYRLGIFNDGYLGSETDFGTIDNTMSRQDFIDWLKEQAKYTYYGGEATKVENDEENEKWSDIENVVKEMPQTHTTYLNREYNKTILDKWKIQSYENSESTYHGKKAYEYIKDHMGYRLVLKESNISKKVKQGEICGVKLKINNLGFGNIIRKQKTSVILKKDNKYYEAELNIDARKFDSGKISDVSFYFYIPNNIEIGEWEVYLKIASNDNSDYTIKFANNDVWYSRLNANYIGKVKIEQNNDTGKSETLKQAFVKNPKEGVEGTLPEEGETNKNIQVKVNYYISLTGELIHEKTVYLPAGTTIDFTNQSNLAELNLKIPDNYQFKFAQSLEITGNWNGYNTITIPEEANKEGYIIQVHLDEEGIASVKLAYYTPEPAQLIGEKIVKIPLGTTIDFTNEENLRVLGIEMPSGYQFNFAQAIEICGNWDGYSSITIPNEATQTMYTILVHMKN